MKLADVLAEWTHDDIREVLHADPDLECTEFEITPENICIYHTPRGLLAVGSGVGEAGATFDAREIRELQKP